MRRILYVLHMGAGKTFVAILVSQRAAAAGLRILFLAHRRELVRQALQKFVQEGIDPNDIGLVMANPSGDDKAFSNKPGAPIQVSSLHTFLNQMEDEAFAHFDIIIVDEAHRAPNASTRRVISAYPEAKILGLTGTPWRYDGQGLGNDFDEIIVGEEVTRLIQYGYLVRPRVFTRPYANLSALARLKVVRGDYDETQLNAIMNDIDLVGDIISHYRTHAFGRPTICFAVGVEHSKSIVRAFRGADVTAEHIDSDTPDETRRKFFESFLRGDIKVLSNCLVLSEGWDCPELKCVILARPTLSRTLYMQQACRCMRPEYVSASIPAPPVILDHSGNALRHGLPDHVRSYDLFVGRGLIASASTKMCPSCGLVMRSGDRICANCSFVFPTSERTVSYIDGHLVEVHRIADNVLMTEFRRLREFASFRNFRKAWIMEVMRVKFGERGYVFAEDRL